MFGINGAGDGFFRIFFWCRWNVQVGALSQVESHSVGSWGSFCPWVSSLPQHGVLTERTTDSPFRAWILSASGIFKEPGAFSGFFDRIYFLYAFFAIFPAKHYNLIRLFWGFSKEVVAFFLPMEFFHVSVSSWVPHEIHQFSSEKSEWTIRPQSLGTKALSGEIQSLKGGRTWNERHGPKA